MGLGKKKTLDARNNLYSEYNTTGPNNPTHDVDNFTNYILRSITLENIDECVYNTFNRRFLIKNEPLDMILMDQEVASYKYQHPEKFDEAKGFLKLPYFIMWRTEGEPVFRSNPSHKQIIYTVPVQQPQGVVYEEYISPAPKVMYFKYTFKFLTTLREYTNEFESQMLEYFKNKRNLIILDKERFEIKPKDYKSIVQVETVKRGDGATNLYISTCEVEVLGYLRDPKDVQKRQRPNSITFKIKEKTDNSVLDEQRIKY